MKNGKFSTRSGETLLEVVIAVSVLMIILAPASALFVSSIRNTAMDKNELIGAALAEEGVEMIRNFRDTNFLRFSSKKKECWNALPVNNTSDVTIDIGNCDEDASKIGDDKNLTPPKYFKLTLDPTNMAWDLESPAQFDLETPGTNDIEIYRLLNDSATGGTNTGVYFVQPSTLATTLPGTDSPFYRQISVQYLNIFDATITPPTYEAMKVTSLVRYKTGTGLSLPIKRVLILTNQPL